MIKENILNFTAVLSLFVLTGSSVNADAIQGNSNNLNVVYVKEFVEPTSPEIRTQLDELDKIILEKEGERKVREAEIRLEAEKQNTLRMNEWAESNLFISKQEIRDREIAKLIAQVGVTPYGFGTTPEIWDCSGLTKWYLQGQDIEVEHSATSQVINGTRVQTPIAGDLVGFQKLGSSDYFHVGVYVGGGLMVHTANVEKNTELRSVEEFANIENSNVVYVRY